MASSRAITMSLLSQSIAAQPRPHPNSSIVFVSPTRPDTVTFRILFVVTMNRLKDVVPLSLSGALAPEAEELDVSRKPRPVIGSGDSCTTLGLGRVVRAVGEVVIDCSRCRYRSTVPSPNPIARCERLEVSAMDVTCCQLRLIIHEIDQNEQAHQGPPGTVLYSNVPKHNGR